MALQHARQLERGDRYVRRSYVRIGKHTSRHRVAFWLEESLRLISLPGENEGRVYYFRRVSLPGIPANAPRNVWIERMEQALTSMASQSVHANDPRAEWASVVYFHNHLEALEVVLGRVVRSESLRSWFWPMVLGDRPTAGGPIHVASVLEVLRQQCIPAGSVAGIILSALGDCDPIPFLSAIPFFTIREWLDELEGPSKQSSISAPAALPQKLRELLQRIAQHFGWNDPRTVWLSALLVLSVAPVQMSASTAVKEARATLRHLETFQASEQNRADSNQRLSDGAVIRFRDDANAVAAGDLSVKESSLELRKRALKNAHQAEYVVPQSLLGEPTAAAGLYFLLNALRQLRLPAAIESCPELAETSLPQHILRRLAANAGVAEDDPIFLGLDPRQKEFFLPSSVFAMLSSNVEVRNAKLWPPNIAPMRNVKLESEDFLRLWAVAVRRWCWRMGQITTHEIVNRPGRIWSSRTDLDITLPLGKSDIRIRRIGLDIDPGWLPWFGKFGRVVRFHYEDCARGGAPC